MIPQTILNKQLLMMTGEEILVLFSTLIREKNTSHRDYTSDNIGCGVAGIGRILKIERNKAQSLKNAGVFDEAIISAPGENIRFLKDKIIECYENHNKPK